jgi:hypothetical protein
MVMGSTGAGGSAGREAHAAADRMRSLAAENLLALTTRVEELLADLGTPPAEPSSSVVPPVGLSPVHVLGIHRT